MHEIDSLEIYPTDRSDTIIGECSIKGHVIPNGNAYNMAYATFVTVRDGSIVNYRPLAGCRRAHAGMGVLSRAYVELQQTDSFAWARGRASMTHVLDGELRPRASSSGGGRAPGRRSAGTSSRPGHQKTSRAPGQPDRAVAG